MSDEWKFKTGTTDRTAMWLLRKLEGFNSDLDDHDVVICVWQELVELRAKIKSLGANQSPEKSVPSVGRDGSIPG